MLKEQRRQVRENLAFAAVQHFGGEASAWQVARKMQISAQAADRLLVALVMKGKLRQFGGSDRGDWYALRCS